MLYRKIRRLNEDIIVSEVDVHQWGFTQIVIVLLVCL